MYIFFFKQGEEEEPNFFFPLFTPLLPKKAIVMGDAILWNCKLHSF